ncbi:PAS domain S-box protein [Candidatus Peregrinibacteria bacterium]|nr:MAG: PAS domain S-box protein [Candidatus Peregrinibacteria bacterium]
MEHLNEAVWMGDDHEKTLYANPKFCSMTGYSLDELLHMSSYELWTPESAALVRTVNERDRAQGISSDYEGELLTKTGAVIPVHLKGTPLPNGGTIGIMTDLRDLRAKEQEIQNLLQHIDLAIKGSRDALWYTEVDLDHLYKNGFQLDYFLNHSVWYSSSEQSITDREEGFNNVSAWLKLIHPQDKFNVLRILEKSLKERSDFELEYRLKRGDHYYWVSMPGKAMYHPEKTRFIWPVRCATSANVRKWNIWWPKKPSALRHFYNITSLPNLSIDDQIQQVLQLGCNLLQQEIAMICKIEGEICTSKYLYAPGFDLKPGKRFSIVGTACECTLQINSPFHFQSSEDIDWHPPCNEKGIESYIGVPVYVGSERYGVLHFSSTTERHVSFQNIDLHFVELMARWLGMMIERQKTEEKLNASKKLLDDLVESSPIATFVLNVDHQIVYWNKGMEDVSGHSALI